MRISIIVFFCVMMANWANSQNPLPVKISGVILDAETKTPLAGEVSFNYKGETTNQGSVLTNTDGRFEIMVSPKNLSLKIKSKSYFTSSISINAAELVVPQIICEIPLVAQQQQQIDQLYTQSTTTKGHTTNNEKPNKNTTTHIFNAVDGISGKIVRAEFRLIYTQNDKTTQFRTDELQPSIKVDFMQKDIIAIEIIANEYQKYLGNLIIETLDNQTHNNTAKLIKTLSFLNVFLQNKDSISNIEISELGNIQTIRAIKNEDVYFALLNINSKYKVNIKYVDGTLDYKEFVAKEGINQLVFSPKMSIEPAYETLYFEQSSVTLKAESMKKLELIIEKMKQVPALKIEITGHTDNTGNYHQNQYLAEFRAKYISNYLFNKGIKTERITVKGDGGTKPKVENDTEEKRSQNRRVEIRLY